MGLPPLEQIPRYEPEELAPLLLAELKEQMKHQGRHKFHYTSTCDRSSAIPLDGDHRAAEAARFPLAEAWAVLVRGGLIAPDAEDSNYGWFFITRRGRQVESPEDVAAALMTAGTPKEIWHSALRTTVYSKFVRGDYENAILEAFKLVEVSVRDASGARPDLLGTDLMRMAFGTESGPLTNTAEVKAEREALGHLFAGAIGRFKNPSSHRLVSTYDADTCRELLSFSSFLLRVVDARRST